MKTCSKCYQEKDLTEFYKNRAQKDGFDCWCKTCHKAYCQSEMGKAIHRRHRQTEKGKISNRRAVDCYQKTAKGKAIQRAAKKRFYARHPNHLKAKNAVNNAIQVGKLSPPDTLLCHYCPKPAQQYHHWKGYEPEHWLDVVPVCTGCHQKYKREIA